MATTLSHLLCQGMIDQGIDALYCLPGVQNDNFFNVLFDHPQLRPFVTRHEQGASYMANGAALASGKPQAYCVVPGQGILNAAAGHSTAYSTAARVLALVGQNRTNFLGQGHGLLHEIDNQIAVLNQISKHTVEIRDGAEGARAIAGAFHALTSGHPAPVTVECPLDFWWTEAEGQPVPDPVFPEVDTDAIDRAAKALANAKAPLIILGGGAHDAAPEIAEIAEMLGAPVSAHRQGKGAYDERKPLAIPLPVAHKLWAGTDVVLAIGTRLQTHEMAWGTDDDLTIIQINANPAEVNRRGKVKIPINAMAEHALPPLIEALGKRLGKTQDRGAEMQELKAKLRAETEHLPQVAQCDVIRQEIGEDGILVDDLTQVSFTARFAYPVYRPRGYVCTGYAGTLGWGLPAGLGAQVACPDQHVVTIQGDGGFGYCAMELATAVHYNIPLVTIVYNDGAYGNVKRIQTERFGGNRTIASTLTNPDIPAFAESFGAMGRRAETPEDLRTALREAFASGGPAMIEVPVKEPMPNPWQWLALPKARGETFGPLWRAQDP